MEPIEDIIEKIKLGDKSLYKGVVEKYQRQIYIYCYQLLGHIQEAEDAAQDIFIKVYEKLYLFDTTTFSFSAWLYKIAYNYCISLIRRRKLLQFVPFADIHSNNQDSPQDKVFEYELSEQLLEALKTLDATNKSIMFLRILEERSYDEIANILNLKSSTVRKRYERSRKKVISNLSQMKGEVKNGYITPC